MIGVCTPVEVWIFIGVNEVSQDRFQLALHSSTEQQGVIFALNPAVVHCSLVSAPVEAWILIGVNAVSQDRFQLALHSSTEQQGVILALNPAAVHW